MSEWVALVLIGFVSAVTAMALMSLVYRRNIDDESVDRPAPQWYWFLTRPFAGMLPAGDERRAKLQQQLYLAGYRQPHMLDNYLATRNLLTVLPIVAGLVTALFVPAEYLFPAVAAGLVVGILGFAMPGAMLNGEAERRGEKLQHGLPVLMDTLGLCLSTGGSIPRSLERSGEAIRRGYTDLSDEVRVVKSQADLRSLDHALHQWRQRIPLPELSGLVFLLSQGDRLGTDITRGLWELSASYRTNIRQRADTAANRVSFQMLFPTVLCLLTAAGIIMVGPGLLKFLGEGERLQQTIRDEVDKAKDGNDIKPIGGRTPPSRPASPPDTPPTN